MSLVNWERAPVLGRQAGLGQEQAGQVAGADRDRPLLDLRQGQRRGGPMVGGRGRVRAGVVGREGRRRVYSHRASLTGSIRGPGGASLPVCPHDRPSIMHGKGRDGGGVPPAAVGGAPADGAGAGTGRSRRNSGRRRDPGGEGSGPVISCPLGMGFGAGGVRASRGSVIGEGGAPAVAATGTVKLRSGSSAWAGSGRRGTSRRWPGWPTGSKSGPSTTRSPAGPRPRRPSWAAPPRRAWAP
jgi:hypothetical protein